MTSSRIGVLAGGSSAGREASLRTGQAVVAALEDAGRESRLVPFGSGAELVTALQREPVDVAFLAHSGRLSGDGCVQGLLEVLGVPYTGSSLLSTALGGDLVKAKELLRLHNVPTPPYYVFEARDCSADLEDLHGAFGFPVLTKPRRGAGREGVSRADGFAALAAGVELALEHDDSVLVERAISGRKISVGLLDGRVLGAAPPGAAGEDRAGVATLEPTRLRGILNLAERAAASVESRGAVLVDLIATEGHNEYVVQVDTQPDLAPGGLFASVAASVGYDYPRLCVALAERARLHRSAAPIGGKLVRLAAAEDTVRPAARAVRVA